jgi:hypothetical protein
MTQMFNRERVITIVSGLPRSGTSMMMRMLHAGGMPVLVDDKRQPDDDNPHGYYEFDAVKRLKHDTSWLPCACGRAVKIVYALLYELDPNYQYQIIVMHRDVSEVVASQRTMLQRLGSTEAPLGAMSVVKTIGRLEVEMDELEDWLLLQRNIRFIVIRYADVLSNTYATCDDVRKFLHVDLDVNAMAAAVDQRLYRQRFSELG